MAQNITLSYRTLVDEALAKIETIQPQDAVQLHGRDDRVLVEMGGIRGLKRAGRGAVARRGALSARHARVLDRPGLALSQAGVRRGQKICVLLRWWLALGAGGGDGAAHGAQARRAYPRRLPRLEGRRRAGGDGGEEVARHPEMRAAERRA